MKADLGQTEGLKLKSMAEKIFSYLDSKHEAKTSGSSSKKEATCLRELRDNWINRGYHCKWIRKYELSKEEGLSQYCYGKALAIDRQKLVLTARDQKTMLPYIVVFNRWTHSAIETYLDVCGDEIAELQIVDNMIFSTHLNGSILVNDLKTKKEVQRFQEMPMSHPPVIHVAHNLLLSCIRVRNEQKQRITSLTIRRIISPTEMPIENQQLVPQWNRVLQLGSNEKFFIVLYRDQFRKVYLELRSPPDFRLLSKTELGTGYVEVPCVAFGNGKMALENKDGAIEIWNIFSRKHEQTLNRDYTVTNYEIQRIRLTSQHAVVQTDSGSLIVYKLSDSRQGYLPWKEKSPNAAHRLYLIENPGESADSTILDVAVDDFQIILSVSNFNRCKSGIKVINFLPSK